jgi:hypothetical protein
LSDSKSKAGGAGETQTGTGGAIALGSTSGATSSTPPESTLATAMLTANSTAQDVSRKRAFIDMFPSAS